MNIPVMVQGIRRCWPGSTFGADQGSNRAPNNIEDMAEFFLTHGAAQP